MGFRTQHCQQRGGYDITVSPDARRRNCIGRVRLLDKQKVGLPSFERSFKPLSNLRTPDPAIHVERHYSHFALSIHHGEFRSLHSWRSASVSSWLSPPVCRAPISPETRPTAATPPPDMKKTTSSVEKCRVQTTPSAPETRSRAPVPRARRRCFSRTKATRFPAGSQTRLNSCAASEVVGNGAPSPTAFTRRSSSGWAPFSANAPYWPSDGKNGPQAQIGTPPGAQSLGGCDVRQRRRNQGQPNTRQSGGGGISRLH